MKPFKYLDIIFFVVVLAALIFAVSSCTATREKDSVRCFAECNENGVSRFECIREAQTENARTTPPVN